MTRDAWLRALEEAHIEVREIRDGRDDQDAVTVTEFAVMFGLAYRTALTRLAALERAGKATRTRKRASAVDGRRRSMVAYRLTT